jgi:hypothetical protein
MACQTVKRACRSAGMACQTGKQACHSARVACRSGDKPCEMAREARSVDGQASSRVPQASIADPQGGFADSQGPIADRQAPIADPQGGSAVSQAFFFVERALAANFASVSGGCEASRDSRARLSSTGSIVRSVARASRFPSVLPAGSLGRTKRRRDRAVLRTRLIRTQRLGRLRPWRSWSSAAPSPSPYRLLPSAFSPSASSRFLVPGSLFPSARSKRWPGWACGLAGPALHSFRA